MVQISKRRLKPNVYDRMFQILFDTLGTNHTSTKLRDLTHIVFSSSERIMVAKRVAALFLLQRNISKADIAQILCLSVGTVYKYCRVTEDNPKTVENMLFVVVKNAEISQFFDELLSESFKPGVLHTNWHGANSRQQDSARKKRYGI